MEALLIVLVVAGVCSWLSYAIAKTSLAATIGFLLGCAVKRRHSSAGANPARQLSLQPVAVGANDGGNDIV